MPIYMYSEWLKESEKVDPQAPATISTTPEATPATPNMPISPNQPTDAGDVSIGMESSPVEETPRSEQEEFEEIDIARKEAISAFKNKQKEFMEIPQEVRNNPVTDEDKTKVESLKAELQTLNSTMKSAVAKYDEFNDKMLGPSNVDPAQEP